MNETPMDVIRRFTNRHNGYPLCARVLYVEDDPAHGALLQIEMEREGFCVDVVSCGETALDLIRVRQARYRILIVDQCLPGISGTETIRMARASGVRIPSIILTAAGTTELATEAEALCVAAYMVKDTSGSHLKTVPILARELIGDPHDRS